MIYNVFFKSALIGATIIASALSAHANPSTDYAEGSFYTLEEEPGCYRQGMYFTIVDHANKEAALTSILCYIDENPGIGGTYGGELNVPATVRGLNDEDADFTVVSVTGLFRNGITVLRLPETIKEIYYTISECKMLREVYLNDNLKELNGIVDCPLLSVCPLPKSLERVGDYFMSGIGLKEIEFPPLLSSIGRKTFSRNYQLETLSLGNLVEAGDSCFNNLPLVKEIVLPESLESLGQGCFNYCWQLHSLTLPSHEVSMPNAFQYCPNLQNITVLAESPYPVPFYLGDPETVLIYVPDESVDAYKEADGWNRYQILPISKSGVNSTSAPLGWSATPGKGTLTIVSDKSRLIDVINTKGNSVAKTTRHGKTEISLPSGVYTVASEGNAVKLIVR